jgi:hypothetical protein
MLGQNFRSFIFSLLIVCFMTIGFAKPAHAQMDPKLKAFLITSGYGIAGGALLGVASVALGAKARAIAQGASLGLYAGMIFGGYIVLSHNYRMSQPEGSYQDATTPYDEGSSSPYGSDPYGAPAGGGGYRYQPMENLQQFKTKRGRANDVPFYMNLVKLRF